MTNKFYQKQKEKLRKKHVKNTKSFLKKKKIKEEKMLEKDIKILMKKNKKKTFVPSWTEKKSLWETKTEASRVY